jgi:hypothetical protein
LDDKGGREKKRNIATTNVEQTVISSDHKGGRVKKRKERADFVLWGDPQYQETQLKDLQETWRQVQEQFLAVKSAFKEVVKQDDLKLGATIYCLGVVMHEQSWRVEAGGCPSGSHLERKWNEVHQLRMKSGYVFDEEREAKAQHFGKLLAQLTSQAALHSFVTEYPNSIDHKRKKPRRKRQG